MEGFHATGSRRLVRLPSAAPKPFEAVEKAPEATLVAD
jgi:hypothetical protein